MIFADNPHDREIEKMMQKTPHFRPRGHGVFVSEKSEYNAERCGCKECADRKKKRRVSGEKTPCVEQRIHEGQIPQPRVLMETFTAVTNPEFIIRINGYIKECERKPMQFRNEKHRSVFENAIKGMNTNNKIKMCALYLLTADGCLWGAAKRHIGKDEIHFFRIRLGKSTPTAYTLFCCAKDLALGSKHMTISDLADGDVVHPKDFAIICNAMAIRRYRTPWTNARKALAQSIESSADKSRKRNRLTDSNKNKTRRTKWQTTISIIRKPNERWRGERISWISSAEWANP